MPGIIISLDTCSDCKQNAFLKSFHRDETLISSAPVYMMHQLFVFYAMLDRQAS